MANSKGNSKIDYIYAFIQFEGLSNKMLSLLKPTKVPYWIGPTHLTTLYNTKFKLILVSL